MEAVPNGTFWLSPLFVRVKPCDSKAPMSQAVVPAIGAGAAPLVYPARARRGQRHRRWIAATEGSGTGQKGEGLGGAAVVAEGR